MPDENPYQAAIRQLEHDIREIKDDAGLVTNIEVLSFIRSLLLEKRKLVLALIKEYEEMMAGPVEERL